MSGPVTIDSWKVRGAGAMGIVVTIVVCSIWGAVGLWSATGLPRAIVSTGWMAIAAGMWAVYGTLLLLLVRRPARRAHVLTIGATLALAWGGLAAIDIAGRANTAVQTMAINASDVGDGSWTTWVASPVIEETVKTLGIVMLALLPAARRFGAGAGLAIGALVGVSFQVVENFVFTLQGMADAPDQPGQVLLSMAFVRGLVGVFSHIVYSGLIGAAVGWLIIGGPEHRARRLATLASAFVLMVGLHSWSNWAADAHAAVVYVITMVVGLVALVVVARRALPRGQLQEVGS